MELIKNMSLIEVGILIGIWGGILSTILAVLKILEYRRDRANMKVTVRGNYAVFPKNTPYGDASLLVITAINIGRRPISIKQAGLLLPRNSKRKYAVFGESIRTVELKEGQSYDYNAKEDSVRQEHNLSSNKYVAYVRDATSRCYWSHNWLMRLIKVGRIK